MENVEEKMDDTTLDTATDNQETEQAQEEIPEELDGLPEDIAREAMQEASEMEPAEPKEDDDSQDADADSDTKHVSEAESVLNQPNYKVPYTRFKAEIDKKKDLEEKLAAYKEKYGDIPKENQPEFQQPPVPAAQQPAINQQPAATQPPVQQVPSMPKLDDNTMKQIDVAVRQQAMQMTGMTQEDLESMEYADDSEAKSSRWKAAMDIAKNNVYSAIRAEVAHRQQATAEFVQRHQAAVDGFNSYYRQEAEAPDFQDVQKYAMTERFNSLPEVDRQILSDAYVRVERNTASPQDIFVVQNYFSASKQDYRAQHPLPDKPAGAALAQKETKLKQAEKHPRSEQVDGTATTDGVAATPANLQHMLDTMKWDDIPKKYQDMLLGGSE